MMILKSIILLAGASSAFQNAHLVPTALPSSPHFVSSAFESSNVAPAKQLRSKQLPQQLSRQRKHTLQRVLLKNRLRDDFYGTGNRGYSGNNYGGYSDEFYDYNGYPNYGYGEYYSSGGYNGYNSPPNSYATNPQQRDMERFEKMGDWKKNNGFKARSIERPLGGSNRDAETNPYYDPGWAQSIRRDNPNSKTDPYSSYGGGYETTYPGMAPASRTNKWYTNPVNPYYDPVWSQSFARNDEPIRDSSYWTNRMFSRDDGYYGPGDGAYFEDGQYDDYGGGMGGSPRLGAGYMMGGGADHDKFSKNNNPLRNRLKLPSHPSINHNSLFQIRQKTKTASNVHTLKMSFYDPEWDGPPFDPRMAYPPPYPPPGYGGGRFRGMPPQNLRELAAGNGGGGNIGAGGRNAMYNDNYVPYPNNMPPGGDGRQQQQLRGMRGTNSNYFRRNPQQQQQQQQQMPQDPFLRQSLRNTDAWSSQPGFGRDNAPSRSLKDMAAQSNSFDAMTISAMNQRGNPLKGEGEVGAIQRGVGGGLGPPALPDEFTSELSSGQVPFSPVRAGGVRSSSSNQNNNAPTQPPSGGRSSEYVPLNALSDTVRPPSPMSPYGPPGMMGDPLMIDLPPTVQVARTVRPSVVLVTSVGKRNENSQGSGFVVEFDDGLDTDDDDSEDSQKIRCHLLSSAHVAPPGWKITVSFPSMDRKFPATVVGRNLNSDLALLRVEVNENDDEYDEDLEFPPPLIMSGEDVSTRIDMDDGYSDGIVPLSEIGSPVYSFGYPMGVDNPTMTSGILSATTKGISEGKDSMEEEGRSTYRPFVGTSFVITDAAMAGGMSGGPLVNYDGIVLGVNALVRPDLRALGNYAVSALECEGFLEKLEADAAAIAGKVNGNTGSAPSTAASRKKKKEEERQQQQDIDNGVAGYRVMLYGGPLTKEQIVAILRRVARIDSSRASNAVQSNYSFGAGVVDEFYVKENGGENAVKTARKNADDLAEKLKAEALLVEVEPVHLLK